MTLRWIRTLTETETEASEKANKLLSDVTTGTPFADLEAATRDLHEQIERLEAGMADGPGSGQERVRRVQREFKSWLSAFRSFDDRTSAWLSKQVGKDHPAFQTFKLGVSREFDQNFAYRLCAALRNATEHAGDVINHVSLSSRLAGPVDSTAPSAVKRDLGAGDRIEKVELGFKGPGLAAAHQRMRSATRAELAAVTEPLSLESVVGTAFLSCMRVHAELVLDLWPEIRPAIEFVTAFHDEASSHGGAGAAFGPEGWSPLDPSTGRLTLRGNSMHEALAAGQLHTQSVVVVAEMPAPTYSPNDLTFG